MTSELNSAAAQTGGAKSQGPKFPETDDKSSHNYLHHEHKQRKTTVLECESDGEFQGMRADYDATYQPGSPVEQSLVDEMVAARWRMLRLRMIETALLDSEINRERLPTDPGYQIAASYRRLADESRALSLASLCESRLHRMHERSHRTLRELQQSRKQQAAEPVVPKPAPPEPSPADPDLWGSAMRCPPAPVAEPVACLDKKTRNEPKPASSAAPRKHVQSLALVGHRGIRAYLGSKRFRCLRQLKTA